MTEEQKKISNINKKKAMIYFGIQDAPRYKYALHHKDISLRHDDVERYIQWNPEDLIVMDYGEHCSLHWTFDHDGRCRKISESNKGKHNHVGENNPNYGKKHPGVGGRPKGSPPTRGSKGMGWKLVDGKRIYYLKESRNEALGQKDSGVA